MQRRLAWPDGAGLPRNGGLAQTLNGCARPTIWPHDNDSAVRLLLAMSKQLPRRAANILGRMAIVSRLYPVMFAVAGGMPVAERHLAEP